MDANSGEPTAVIIEAAINGATEGRSEPHLPRSSAEVAEDTLRCMEAGAAIVHSHTDQPFPHEGTGELEAQRYEGAWRTVLERRPDAILYPTIAGGGPGRPIEGRFRHQIALAEAGLLRMGIIFPSGATDNSGGQESPIEAQLDDDTHYSFDTMQRLRLAPRISITGLELLPAVVEYERVGRMPRGGYYSLYFSGEAESVWGQFAPAPTIANLEAYLRVLEGSTLPWSVRVMSGDVVEAGLARWALERGGHVCVGLEDYGGPREPTNEELVREFVTIADAVGRPVASCTSAAQMLDLPRPSPGAPGAATS